MGNRFTDTHLRILGQAVKAIREARGYSVTEFAEAVGTTRSYMANIEQLRKQPSYQLVVAIARELAVPVTAITVNLDTIAEEMAVVEAANQAAS
jgi:transcriptional regulator with XRE-family HTH domain